MSACKICKKDIIYPLSLGQKALWFVKNISPDKCAFNISLAWHIPCFPDIMVLKDALKTICAVHPILRTTYHVNDDGDLYQKVHPDILLKFEETDCTSFSKAFLNSVLKEETYRPIDLENGPVSRWKLFHKSRNNDILFFSIHHIAADYGSIIMMMEDLSSIFETGRLHEQEEKDTDFRYGEFIKYQSAGFHGIKKEKLSRYWKKQLSKQPSVLNLPLDKPRPPVSNYRGDQYTLMIPKGLSSRIINLSKKTGISPYTFFLSAFSILLHRYSYQDTIFVVSPMSGRTLPYKDVAGYFVNPVVLKSDFSEDPALMPFLKQMHKTVFSAMLHKDFPFSELPEILQMTRDASHRPFAQATFNWVDYEAFQKRKKPFVTVKDSGKIEWQINGMIWEQIDLRGQTDDSDLVLEILKADGNFLIHWQYNETVFNRPGMMGMANAFISLLHGMVNFPSQSVNRLPLLGNTEIKQILKGWKYKPSRFKKNACVHHWFEAQAGLRPDEIALIDGHEELTYLELNCRANQVAHYLTDLGIGPEILVGICMDRTAFTIVCLMGVLKAGAAYVPLDPQYPRDRLDFIIKDADIAFVLTQKRHRNCLPADSKNIITVEDARDVIKSKQTTNPSVAVKLSNMAYVIYTSGTTGRPKGVVIEHNSVSALFNSYSGVFSQKEMSGVLAATSLNFDPSVVDIFGTLGLGGTLILIENPLMLSALPAKDRITLISAAPSLIKALFELKAIPASVTSVGMGGEPLRQELVNDLYSLNHIKKVFNFYGPTEETVCAAYALVEPHLDHAPPLGRPMSKTRIHILDPYMQPVPEGMPGELYLGGPGLARGYLNRPELTRNRFIPNPFAKDKDCRLFKTGDLVRLLPGGDIAFIGRMDCQVKIRGFRIELGEIETIINLCPNVKESVATVSEDSSGDNILLAYVVPESGSQVTDKDIREFIRKKLPLYMMPAHITLIGMLPLTPNGKIDRNGLPKPKVQKAHPCLKTIETSQANSIKIVSDIWEDVLKLSGINIQDNFFDLGGHSLLMVSVFSKLKQHFDKEISLIDLYQYPTVYSLANFLDRSEADKRYIKKSKNGSVAVIKRYKTPHTSKIAIIGMACRYPGAAGKDEFWQNIKNGVESISDFSKQELLENGISERLIRHRHFIPRSGWLAGIDQFDADFFNITPMEARIIDPQHRIFMECAWEALEDAGIDPHRTDDITGIYAGCGQNAYYTDHLSRHRKIRDQMGDFNLMIGNSIDFLSSRIGYKLNLKGPMTTIQTACSTSMTGIHMACSGLFNGDCDIALAGGISLGNLKKGYLYREGMILSSSGQCRPFDRDASGTIPSQGVGIVVLKRLSDAINERRHIYAIIAGSAINNDGIGKAGFTAPSVTGQAEVIRSAQINAGVVPGQISFIEAHGTATNVGDPIETAALETVFSGYHLKKGSCAVGAVKANIGHTDTASGVAGVIKTALAIKHKMLPPSIHYEQPNSHIKFSDPPFYINTKLKPWTTDKLPRRAGVSSFGLGGCNAHTILEEYEDVTPSDAGEPGWHIFPISAKTRTALITAARNLKGHLEQKQYKNLADIAYTLQKGRRNFDFRTFFVADSNARAIEQLTYVIETQDHEYLLKNTRPPVVFMFTGQGSQYMNMGKDLYSREPFFKKQVDECLDIISRINAEMFNLFNKGKNIWDTNALSETAITQPALFIFEYALARLLMHWEIDPDVMIGHSLGEYVAACIAKVFSLEEALDAVVQRGLLIRELPAGKMMSVGCAKEKVKELIFGSICIAAVNTPLRTVVSGAGQDMEKFKGICKNFNIPVVPLKISHAFHSGMLDPILEKYRTVLSSFHLNPPQIPIVSSLTGTWLTKAQATDPSYWVLQMRNPVHFSDGLATLFDHYPKMAMIETGPGRTLSSLALQNPGRQRDHLVLPTVRAPGEIADDKAFLLNAVGVLWNNGLCPKWEKLHQGNPGFISLPSYPFERKRYWVEETANLPALNTGSDNEPESKPVIKFNDTVEKTVAHIWEEFLGLHNLSVQDDFFKLGGDSLLAVMMLEQLRDRFDIDLSANILISCSTIGSLARYIRDRSVSKSLKTDPRAASEYIVELKKGCLSPALFLCHPGAGHLYFYLDLVHALNIPNAIYGIEAKGLHGNDRPLESIEEIAAHHVDQIMKIQKKGPYWLGGSSFGGMVAYEAAQQLIKRGHKIEFIYMADTPGPGHMVPPVKSNAQILCRLFPNILDSAGNLEKELYGFEDDPNRQIDCIIQKAQAQNKGDMIPDRFSSDFINMIKIHVEAMRRYTPGPIMSFLMFFRANEPLEDYDAHAEMAWLPLAETGANVYTVPGNHITMNSAPNVNVMARQMKRHIRDLLNINR